MSRSFPLATLQPIVDGRNAWAALMFDPVPADGLAIARAFGEFGLAEALGPLPCVLNLPDLAAVADGLPAAKIVLRLPVEFCCDPAQSDALRALQAKGFGIMATGLPAAGQELCDAVQAMALRGGDAAASDMDAWLGRLPGPHLALDAAAASSGSSQFQW